MAIGRGGIDRKGFVGVGYLGIFLHCVPRAPQQPLMRQQALHPRTPRSISYAHQILALLQEVVVSQNNRDATHREDSRQMQEDQHETEMLMQF